MPKKKASQDLDKMDFETALTELQQVVDRMENEQQSLEASIADYEKGMALSKLCQKHLDAAQLKVEMLVKGNKGEHFEPFSADDND